jgi:hypothetical protein
MLFARQLGRFYDILDNVTHSRFILKRLLNHGCLTYSVVANNSLACFEVLFLKLSSDFVTAMPVE